MVFSLRPHSRIECYLLGVRAAESEPGRADWDFKGARQGAFEGDDRKVFPISSVLLSELWESSETAANQVKAEVKDYLSDKSYD